MEIFGFIFFNENNAYKARKAAFLLLLDISEKINVNGSLPKK